MPSSSFVVVVHNAQTYSALKPRDQSSQISCRGRTNVCIIAPGYITRIATMSIYVKILTSRAVSHMI